MNEYHSESDPELSCKNLKKHPVLCSVCCLEKNPSLFFSPVSIVSLDPQSLVVLQRGTKKLGCC